MIAFYIMQIICSWNPNKQSIFQTCDFTINFHKYVDDSQHWTETYLPLSTNSDFSSILKQNMWCLQQVKDTFYVQYMKIVYTKHVFEIANSNSNKMTLFREFLPRAIFFFAGTIIFHTLKSRSLGGPAFQEHQKIICIYNKTEELPRRVGKKSSIFCPNGPKG